MVNVRATCYLFPQYGHFRVVSRFTCFHVMKLFARRTNLRRDVPSALPLTEFIYGKNFMPTVLVLIVWEGSSCRRGQFNG